MTDGAMIAKADRMSAIKAAWVKASPGLNKDEALRHYQAAERAQAARNVAGNSTRRPAP